MSVINEPKHKHLNQYKKPNFNIEKVFLTFELKPNKSIVTNLMQIKRLKEGIFPLVLDGELLILKQIKLNGIKLSRDEYIVTDVDLTILTVLDEFELEILTEINPEKNTHLEGLYLSNGIYCTQCEAEGFRKITYFLDRPDVLSVFTTKIISVNKPYSAILSNGNLIESGTLDTGEYYAVWEDPFKKPCYLFALVAGDLQFIEDLFTTMDGRKIILRIYVEEHNIDKCWHAMNSLKRSMQWDEERFGLSYDLDIYMIVAVDAFNMGAMENKGLNIFNSKYVLAKPKTATDEDYEAIEAVIAHEYFHNWTGNRVTCRDWFQLTLKEGLTVFRDQEFTSDMLDRDVKRIEDVNRLRNYQFLEDSGPISHPIQPQSYIEINNFYTATVYEKGAEIIRLYHTLLGKSNFRSGMDLYFKRHDGQAVTVEDFRNAMEDASGINLEQFKSWYTQSGTPLLKVKGLYSAINRTYTLKCEQFIRDKQEHKPFIIPIKIGLLNIKGESLCLYSKDDSINLHNKDEASLIMTNLKQDFTFKEIESEPIPSLLRTFSAPVILDYTYTKEQLCTIAIHDSDTFMRWEAVQRLAMICIEENIIRFEEKKAFKLNEHYAQVFLTILESTEMNPAFIARAIMLPSINVIGSRYDTINVEAIYTTYNTMKVELAERFKQELKLCYKKNHKNKPFVYESCVMAQRLLKNCCLSYLSKLENKDEFILFATQQYEAQDNMTDVLSVIELIRDTSLEIRDKLVKNFYNRWSNDTLVIDKWFALQSSSFHKQVLQHVKTLIKHPDFTYKNPNRVRSVLGSFVGSNLMGFHRKDGKGYEFLADEIIKLDKINPQISARMVTSFTRWQRYDEFRKAQMYKQLQKILEQSNLSKGLFEVVAQSIQN